jgi:Protein of unknown function (DUF3060)
LRFFAGLPDSLSHRALFAGSGQTTTLDCAGGGAHIFGSNNKLTLTGECAWLDMVGSNNVITDALAKDRLATEAVGQAVTIERRRIAHSEMAH